MSSEPIVSVVIPVRNGSGKLQHCLDSLMRQDVPGATCEIIVADGRSSDDTIEIAKAYGCRVIDNPRQTVAGGRNVGMAVARGRFIASTEDDIVLPPGWLSAGLRALADDSVGAVGGPTPIPLTSRPFAKAVDLLFRAAAGIGYSVQSGKSGPVREVTDLPGGNVMYRREVLAAVLPVDELLVTGEDVDLHARLRARGNKLVFVPEFLAWHHKRDSPGRFFHQIRRFAQGRVQVGRIHKGVLRPVHWLMALLPVPVIVALMLLSPLALGLAAAAGAIATIAVALTSGAGVRASLWMPVVTAIFLVAWPAGFLRELLFPIKDATGR